MRWLMLIFVLMLCGCDGDRVGTGTKPRETTAAELQAEQDLAAKRDQVARLAKDNEGKAKTIDELNERIAAREQIISTARADIVGLRKDRDALHEAQIAAVLGWTAAALGLVMLAALFAAWLSPIGKKTFLSLAFLAGVLVPVALAARAYVHWLPMIGVGVVVAAVAAALWAWHRLERTSTTAGSHLKLYANQLAAIDPDLKARVDRLSLSMQDLGGGRTLLDHLLNRAPEPAIPPLAGAVEFTADDLPPVSTDTLPAQNP